MENIKLILQFHNVQVPPHLKIDDLRDMLLVHCNTTKSTFPVCFVPDSEMPHISVHTASEKCHEELETNEELDSDKKYVPISFVSDSIINIVKAHTSSSAVNETIDKECSLKRSTLTPNKDGYRSEMHKTKKQQQLKWKKSAKTITSDSDESLEEYM